MMPLMDLKSSPDRRFAEELPGSEVTRLLRLKARSDAADANATLARNSLRRLILDLRTRGRSAGKIAEVLGMSRQTMYKITGEQFK